MTCLMTATLLSFLLVFSSLSPFHMLFLILWRQTKISTNSYTFIMSICFLVRLVHLCLVLISFQDVYSLRKETSVHIRSARHSDWSMNCITICTRMRGRYKLCLLRTCIRELAENIADFKGSTKKVSSFERFLNELATDTVCSSNLLAQEFVNDHVYK